MADYIYRPSVTKHTVNLGITANPLIPFRDSLQAAALFRSEASDYNIFIIVDYHADTLTVTVISGTSHQTGTFATLYRTEPTTEF